MTNGYSQASAGNQLPPPAGSEHAARRVSGHIHALLHGAVNPVETAQPPVVSRDVLASVLDKLATAVVLVDRRLSILQGNAAAYAVLASGLPLAAIGGKLIVAPSAGPALVNAICAAASGCLLRRSLIVQVPGMPAIAVWLQPVDQCLQTAAAQWHNGIVSLAIKPLASPQVKATPLLRSHYGLTARQEQIVGYLKQGTSLDEAATSMAIGMPTARSHLARCFEKTGTRRQTDLIALALSLDPPILD